MKSVVNFLIFLKIVMKLIELKKVEDGNFGTEL